MGDGYPKPLSAHERRRLQADDEAANERQMHARPNIPPEVDDAKVDRCEWSKYQTHRFVTVTTKAGTTKTVCEFCARNLKSCWLVKP